VVEISPARAAENLKNILGEHDVVMFEYFLTDFMGHKGSAKEKKFILNHLDRFLKKLIGKLDMKNNTVVICSDHGNIEDERGKQHTENPVPTLVFSENPEVLDYFEDKVKRITEVAPAIIQGFERGIFNPAAPADER
jgi:2,3-bisphosphoglycerate-independent phosphoglycerate mutase